MNNERRQAIRKVAAAIANQVSELESLIDDERYYLENVPESLQNGYEYQTAEDNCDELEGFKDEITYQLDNIEGIL